MVFGNIRDRKDYAWLEDVVGKCFDYANTHDLLSFEKGSHTIDGDDLFVNIVEYETTNAADRFWEAHRQYLDLTSCSAAPEQIDVNFIDNMEQKEFVEKDDFLPLEGEPNSHVVLNAGDFLLCYPADAHRTAVKVGSPPPSKRRSLRSKLNKSAGPFLF